MTRGTAPAASVDNYKEISLHLSSYRLRPANFGNSQVHAVMQAHNQGRFIPRTRKIKQCDVSLNPPTTVRC